MPWLAPIDTPPWLCSIACQAPSGQRNRATRSGSCLTYLLLVLVLMLALSPLVSAEQDPHAKHRGMMKHSDPEPAAEFADIDLRDRLLLNQDGKEVLFVSDVIGDRIVVMDNGGAVLEGTPQSLKRRVGSERADLTLATPRDRMTVTTLLGDQLIIEQTETTLGLAINDPWQLNSLLTRLRVSGIKPVAMTVTQPTLDDVFFAVAGTRVDGQRRETA